MANAIGASTGSSTLYKIDTATGNGTRVGSLGFTVGGLAFNWSGNRYAHNWDNDHLVTINKSTASFTDIGPFHIDANNALYGNLAFNGGVLYMGSCRKLVLFRPTKLSSVSYWDGRKTTIGSNK
jgi:hypothetical protein